jgi:hypothetical protein
MKLIFKHKFSCGNHRYYPASKEAEALALVKGSPSLSEEEIGYLHVAGFEMEFQSFEDEHIKEVSEKFKKKQK